VRGAQGEGWEGGAGPRGPREQWTREGAGPGRCGGRVCCEAAPLPPGDELVLPKPAGPSHPPTGCPPRPQCCAPAGGGNPHFPFHPLLVTPPSSWPPRRNPRHCPSIPASVRCSVHPALPALGATPLSSVQPGLRRKEQLGKPQSWVRVAAPRLLGSLTLSLVLTH
jgi:hypothetical protein